MQIEAVWHTGVVLGELKQAATGSLPSPPGVGREVREVTNPAFTLFCVHTGVSYMCVCTLIRYLGPLVVLVFQYVVYCCPADGRQEIFFGHGIHKTRAGATMFGSPARVLDMGCVDVFLLVGAARRQQQPRA